jgi:hypothetical protein
LASKIGWKSDKNWCIKDQGALPSGIFFKIAFSDHFLHIFSPSSCNQIKMKWQMKTLTIDCAIKRNYHLLEAVGLVLGVVGRLAEGVVVGAGVEEGALVVRRVGQVAARQRHVHLAAAQLLHAPPRRLKVARAQHPAAPELFFFKF